MQTHPSLQPGKSAPDLAPAQPVFSRTLEKSSLKGKILYLLLIQFITYLWRQKLASSAIFVDKSYMARYDSLQFVWLNLASFVKSATYWNYYEQFGAFCFSESRLLHWHLSTINSIKLLTEIELKVLLGVQTEIMDSALDISSSFGAIPRLSCWPDHKQLFGTNLMETTIRSWHTFTTTYQANCNTKHRLYNISQWGAFQLLRDVIFLF